MEPLVALMRLYAIDYTASHDLDVCDRIMVPDYVLHIGGHHISGRDDQYKAAVRGQMEQFPTLNFTVHEVITNGDRLAMHFSEHGASARHGGRLASWSGISTYRWDGTALTECWVEQDYFSRRRQLETGVPNPVEPPGVDPWAAAAVPADPAAEAVVRSWMEAGELAVDGGDVVLDDEWTAPADRVALDGVETHVDDICSCGDRVAFHVTRTGTYRGGLPGLDQFLGSRVTDHASGIATVHDGAIRSVRAITDRLGIVRRGVQQ